MIRSDLREIVDSQKNGIVWKSVLVWRQTNTDTSRKLAFALSIYELVNYDYAFLCLAPDGRDKAKQIII